MRRFLRSSQPWRAICLLALFLGLSFTVTAQYTISTFAGGGVGDGGPATSARLNSPASVIKDAAGNIYIADGSHHRIRKVNPEGIITTVAGNGTQGFSGDGGAATAASLNFPNSIAINSSGELYISDSNNNRIRKVSTEGIITTIAGNGTADFGGDGGQATAASLNRCGDIILDGAGNLIISDRGNHRIRKISTTGIINTIAGTGVSGFIGNNGDALLAQLNSPSGLALDAEGNLYISDTWNHRIRKINTNGIISSIAGLGFDSGLTGNGGLATSASVPNPGGLTINSIGEIYLTDSNRRVRKISTDGIISIAAGGNSEFPLGDGGPATSAALYSPSDVIVDEAGNLLIAMGNNIVADGAYNRIRIVNTSTGIINTMAGGANRFSGDGGPATLSMLNSPNEITTDEAGNIYFADRNNHRVRKIAADGTISTIAGTGFFEFPAVTLYNGDNQPATSANLFYPTGVAFHAGNLFIADQNNHRIRKIDASGNITTVAGNGTAGFGGDGGAAIEANLNFPHGVAVDAAGNLFITDMNNHRVRKVTTDGIITTIAGNGVAGQGEEGLAVNSSFSYPKGITIDDLGRIYIADAGNNRIRRISTNGFIGSVASSGLWGPYSVAVNSAGVLHISDTGNHRIKRLESDGTLTTIAGSSDGFINSGFKGDGGSATDAFLNKPYGIAIDGSGNIYIADSFNNRIRKLALPQPTITLSTSPAICPGATTIQIPYTATTNSPNLYTVTGTGVAANQTGTLSGTSGTITVSITPATFTGSFTVVVQITSTGATSEPVAGTVAFNTTTITTQPPANTTVCEGTGTSVTVVATGGNLSYQWSLDGRQIKGQTSATLTLSNVTSRDAGSYTCTVTGTCGSVTSSAFVLSVSGATTLAKQQAVSEAVCQGGAFTATVSATGAELQYQWYKDGTAEENKVASQTSATLSLTNVQAQDAGTYRCVVTGLCGAPVTSTSFTLAVKELTVITQQPDATVTVATGGSFTISVAATGANLKYQWSKDGSRIGGQTSSSLTLNRVKASAAGSYTCTVTGDCGILTSNASVVTVGSTSTARLAAIEEEETTLQLQVDLYPNPTVTNTVSVLIKGAAHQPVRLQLVDLKGQVVLQRDLQVETQQHTEVLDVTRVPAGMLLLRVSTAGEQVVKKLLKQ
jgi:trimeric autotransporter adhesin